MIFDSATSTETPCSISTVPDISFSLPTDIKTNVTITLTNKDGVELLFENVPISKCIMCVHIILLYCTSSCARSARFATCARSS